MRVHPGSRRELGLPIWLFTQVAGLVTGTRPPLLFRTLGRNRALFRGWLGFARRLMPGGTLPRGETELVILRVAHLRGCDYEFTHHARLAARFGVIADEVRVGPSAACWSPRERALLAAADQLVTDRDLDDATWTALRGQLDERECIELCLLAAHYDMLATVIAALRIPPDPRRR